MPRSGSLIIVSLVAIMMVTATIVILPQEEEGMFHYPSGMVENDFTDICYYTDDYFTKPSTQYDDSFATATLCFAMSAFMSNIHDGDYENKSCNAKEFLRMYDFRNIDANDGYDQKPTKDSIGIVFGEKTVDDDGKDYTLIAVGVRGYGYEAEWAGNFIVGTEDEREGHHKGFYDAAKIVLDDLESYISENRISGDIKVWITGYSRGAAVTNIAAGLLDMSIANGEPVLGGNVTLDKEDLYAYCFEAPSGVYYEEGGEYPDPTSDIYNNIWSIINRNDPVTMLLMKSIGFQRYGTDKYLPDSKCTEGYEERMEHMLEYYDAMDSRPIMMDYAIDDFVVYKITLGDNILTDSVIEVDPDRADETQWMVLEECMDFVIAEAGGREGYVRDVETGLVDLFDDICTHADDKMLLELMETLALTLFLTTDIEELVNYIVEGDHEGIVDGLVDAIRISLDAKGFDSTKAESYADTIATILVILNGAFKDQRMCSNFVTLAMNIAGVGGAHYPELCFAWLKSMDPNY